jgi:hypothetical protein
MDLIGAVFGGISSESTEGLSFSESAGVALERGCIVSRPDVHKVWPCRARGQHINLPKHEVAEVGYRAIRDWLLDNIGEGIDTSKTTSQIVIELLESHFDEEDR